MLDKQWAEDKARQIMFDYEGEETTTYTQLLPIIVKGLMKAIARGLQPQYQISTSHVKPPIPTTKFDWCAYIDGDEEHGPYGWGEIEELAIIDLKEQLND